MCHKEEQKFKKSEPANFVNENGSKHHHYTKGLCSASKGACGRDAQVGAGLLESQSEDVTQTKLDMTGS